MLKFFLTILAFTVFYSATAQDSIFVHYLKRDIYEKKKEEMQSQFGRNKTIPLEIELECLTALSFFREFSNFKIEFRYKKFRTNATMMVSPTRLSLVKRKEKRTYIIEINNNQGKKKGTDIRDLSFNALVGIIGHELGHIVYYNKKNSFNILWMGIKYMLSKKYIRNVEHAADIETIRHGLGFSIFEFRERSLKNPKTTEEYKNKIRKFYFLPEEILMEIKKAKNKNAGQ
ncbi:MAG: hypothetical protein HY958_04760 [Bacteroidia bacterium]|nr:hypothetical protein [Bacteroidia bacterium]